MLLFFIYVTILRRLISMQNKIISVRPIYYATAKWIDGFTALKIHEILREDVLPLSAYRLGITLHYSDVTMGTMASLITSLTSVYSTVHPGADQRKHQSSASLAFVRGIHRRSVNSPHKWPVTRKIFPFDDVIMALTHLVTLISRQRYGHWRCHITQKTDALLQ